MKKFRKILALALVICCCMGIGCTSSIVKAATTTVNLTNCTVTPGYSMRWFPKGQTAGHKLTEGGTQSMQFYLGEMGNQISIGFMKYSTKTNYPFYTGTVNAYSKSVSKTLTGSTAYYQPYLSNRNETVYINVKSSSYVKIQ
ncbi:MAG: hypothetical protein IKJ01_04070 [Lachnospiraceae bacterium]|nr:hypothetical protein [Lachnospiraceae bacterium]